MGWLYREADQHKCVVPIDKNSRDGDLYECETCTKVHVVRSDQRDGAYAVYAKPEDIERKLGRTH